MSKATNIWDQLYLRYSSSTDLTASILAVDGTGKVVIRPAINTTSFLSSALTNGHVFIGNGSNIATDVAVTGDVTISNTGVTAIGTGVIVNADINTSAAIAVNKLQALTASRVATLDGSGFLSASSVTLTTLGFLDPTSSIQTQLNSKLTAVITTVASGDMLRYNGTNWVNFAKGTDGQFLKLTAGTPGWATLTPPNIPIGGTAGQYLNKIDGTDYNSQWSTLILSKVTDVTATFTEVNKLSGVTTTSAQFNYLSDTTGLIQNQLNGKQVTITGGASTVATSNLSANFALIANGSGKIAVSTVTSATLAFLDATSSVQTQFNNKLNNTLAANAIWVGDVSSVPQPLVAGTNGQVLTISGGTPTWQTVTGTGTVTSVAVSGGTTGLTTSGGPITTTGTITFAGTLIAANGGTSFASYTTGDILYASGATALSKRGIGSIGQVLTVVAGVPNWAASSTAASGEITKSNGTSLVPSGIFAGTVGSLVLGSASIAGDRTITTSGSGTNSNLTFNTQGAGSALNLNINSSGTNFLSLNLLSYDAIVARRAVTIGASTHLYVPVYTNSTNPGGVRAFGKMQIETEATSAGTNSGDLVIRTGDAYTGNNNSGNVIIEAGAKTGSGTKGNVKMISLPTSSAGLASGCLWNNSGVVNIIP